MRHSLALIITMVLVLLTGAARANHLKGGYLSWVPEGVDAERGFKVRAKIILILDARESYDNGTGVEVGGRRLFQPGDIIVPNTGQVVLHWGDAIPAEDEVKLQWANDQPTTNDPVAKLRVVKVDHALQLVAAEPFFELEPEEEDPLVHYYHPSDPDADVQYKPYIVGVNRDGPASLANRQGSQGTRTNMRLESLVKVNLNNPSTNSPPVFQMDDPATTDDDATLPFLRIVNRAAAPVQQVQQMVTFDVPVAKDPESNDLVKYRFVDLEGEATYQGPGGDSWEEINIGPNLADNAAATAKGIKADGQVRWYNHNIPQTILTYCIQVVAEDFSGGNAKSKTTLEFQVWVDDKTQTGLPQIMIEDDLEEAKAFEGHTVTFGIEGTDTHANVYENSLLTVVDAAVANPTLAPWPEGVVVVPGSGFAGLEGGTEVKMEAVVAWEPGPEDVRPEPYIVSFQVKDEDGYLSEVVSVAITVTAPPAALELNVTPGENIQVQNRTPVTFTLNGSGGGQDVDIDLTMTGGTMPLGASFTSPLPVSGTGSLSTTFNWTPPLEAGNNSVFTFTFLLRDAYQREVTKTVSITVTAAPLVLTISPEPPASPQPLIVHPNQQVSFTVTGTCAEPGPFSLTLSMTGKPFTAQVSPSLPRTTTNGTVSTTFTWTPQFNEVLPTPNVMIFTLKDMFNRTVTRTVRILVAPDPPSLVLGSGVTQPVESPLWASTPVPVVATRGQYSIDGTMTLTATTGSFSPASSGSSATTLNSTYRYVAYPGEVTPLQQRTVTLTVTDAWGQTASLDVTFHVLTYPPNWWYQGERPNSQPYAMINQGQFKDLAKRAYERLDTGYPVLTTQPAWVELGAYVNAFTNTRNYEPLRAGQLKHAVSLFYEVLRIARNEPNLPFPYGNEVPGTGADHEPVNEGQLKSAFSFPIP